MLRFAFCAGKLFEDGSNFQTLGKKGVDGIHTVCAQRNESITVAVGDKVHNKCRITYIRPRNVKDAVEAVRASQGSLPKASRRSLDSGFDYQSQCIYCTKKVTYRSRKRGHDVHKVSTKIISETVRDKCTERIDTLDDQWTKEVLSRIEYAAQDLFAYDAVYHHQCDSNFRNNQQVPVDFQDGEPPVKLGRKVNDIRDEAFKKVIEYLKENDEEQTTIAELCEMMGQYLKDEDCEAYSQTHMKRKLSETLEDRIIITNIKGKQNVVTFKEKASRILLDFKEALKLDETSFKRAIIEACGKFIKSDAKDINQDRQVYPDVTEICDIERALAFLPDSLRFLLQQIIIVGTNADIYIASIGQAILQRCRPRILICPLQLGYSVQLHHNSGLRFLVDIASHLGFGVSYSEVQRYQANAAVSSDETELSECKDNQLGQFSADNVDHNTRTIDGKNTLHVMGIIYMVTPGNFATKHISRKPVTSRDAKVAAKIDIYTWEGTKTLQIKYKSLMPFVTNLQSSIKKDIVDEIWNMSFLLKPSRPNWSGAMQLLSKGKYPGKSEVIFLPMVDMDPNDMTCVHSTLRYIFKLCLKIKAIPVITFDLPLFLKAYIVIMSLPDDDELKQIILRLGPFHTIMSFVGSIGHIMAGSGLEDLLSTIYAPNTVCSMLMGKAIARALRGLVLVETALHTKLLLEALDLPLETLSLMDTNKPFPPGPWSPSYQLVLRGRKIMSKLFQDEDLIKEDLLIVKQLHSTVNSYMATLISCPTAKLWMQCLEMISLLREFIKAERIGDWCLHLSTLIKMLPYFAAAGHNHYTKGSHIYVQSMETLEKRNPAVYYKFKDGYHVIRRSDRYWAGLSTDLVIEQTLMKSMKSTGGLTHGRGVNEEQRAVWLLSRPACTAVNEAMQTLTNVTYITSEQHKDATPARLKRDSEDTMKLLEFLQNHNPFVKEQRLHSISSGIAADQSSNAHDAKAVGENILRKMEGKPVSEYTFRRVDQVKTLAAKSIIKCGDEIVQVNPLLLFDRLVKASNDLTADMVYEFTPHPAALFDECGMMRRGTKSSILNDDLFKVEKVSVPANNICHVIDGGSLLYRVQWDVGKSFGEIARSYVSYVHNNYKEPIVVFDGYEPSTKDHARKIRQKGIADASAVITEDNIFNTKKGQFLKNSENKANFVKLLAKIMSNEGIHVEECTADADTTIVKDAVLSAKNSTTVVIGEDTDLLLLLCYHTKKTSKDIYFKHGTTSSNKVWHVQQLQKKLGPELCLDILTLHAFYGCDTSSSLFNVGKTGCLKLYRQDKDFRTAVSQFRLPNVPKEEIHWAGNYIMLATYKGNKGQALKDFRHDKYQEKKKFSGFVHPRTLPPTPSASCKHSERVYLTVQDWIGNILDPIKWGWEIVEGCYQPVYTDLPPGPKDLLNNICCGCTTSNCAGGRCGCKKLGLQCSSMCKECKGVSCKNAMTIDEEPEDVSVIGDFDGDVI